MDLNRNDYLLVNALQLCFNAERLYELKDLSESDWEGLVENAIQHGVSPFLWHHIIPIYSSLNITPNVVNGFTKTYVNSIGRGVVVRNQLSGLLQTFVENNIPVIVLKGAHLADKVYKDFSIRPMTDIDVLIKPEDSRIIENALLSNEYVAMRSTSEPMHSNHYIYQPTGNGVRLEVHVALQPKGNGSEIVLGKLWERSEATTIIGYNTRVLALEDLILYQCCHLSTHLFKHYALRSLCDLGLIIKNNDSNINWGILTRRSEEWHVVNGIHITMELLNRYFKIATPATFMPCQGSPKEGMFTIDTFNTDIFDSKKNNSTVVPRSEVQDAVILLNTIKNHNILQRLFSAAFPDSDAIVKRYKTEASSRPILYLYVYNIKCLITRYSRIVAKLLTGNTELVKHVKDETNHQKTQMQKKEWLQV